MFNNIFKKSIEYKKVRKGINLKTKFLKCKTFTQTQMFTKKFIERAHLCIHVRVLCLFEKKLEKNKLKCSNTMQNLKNKINKQKNLLKYNILMF